MNGSCIKSCFHSKVGLTLIELLVVVLIIGILAAVAVLQYQKAVDLSRFHSLMVITNEIAQAQEVYYLANGHYATGLNQLDIDLSSSNMGDIQCSTMSVYSNCHNTKTLYNEYGVRHQHVDPLPGARLCGVKKGDAYKRFEKVCSHLGSLINSSADCSIGTCKTYKLK